MSTLELSKSLGLTPKRNDKETDLFYSGAYSDYKDVPCKLVDLICEEPKIVRIMVNSELHDIFLDYLIEMQTTHREKERSEHSATVSRQDKGESLLFFPDSFCVVDLETTGFSPRYDDIIEISILKIEDNAIINTFSSLIYCKYIPENITQLTGITQEMVETAPRIEDILPKVIKFIGDSVIVGHNVSFDINFLYDSMFEHLGYSFSNDFVCTKRIFNRLHPELPHHRLCDMSDFYKVINKNAHRAIEDCYATFECLKKMKEEAIQSFGSATVPPSSFKCSVHKSSFTRFTISNCDKDNPDNPLVDKHCVFTGTLSKMSRNEAHQLVEALGGIFDESVTQKTNYLILGDYEYNKSIKDGKSNKHKKADKLLSDGYDIMIITESVFFDLIENFVDFGGNI